MKKAFLIALAFIFAPMAAHAADYKEGVNYTVINQGPATAKPEITEFFSFYCPHCYHFQKQVIPTLKERLPAGVKFNQSHVDFIGGKMGVEMSRAFAIARQLKVTDKVEPAIFSAIHEKKQHFTNLSDIKAIFVANGVDAKVFDGAANSFMVNAQMSKMRHDAQDARISGVPSLVVNGKYLVKNESIKSYDELLDIAFYLTTLK